MPPAFAVPITFHRSNVIARILEAEHMKEGSKGLSKIYLTYTNNLSSNLSIIHLVIPVHLKY